ncbi:hypothetical protein HPB50_006988 [Hyalomma asiaticum]|uniref:Uncharacterized protein n=1 Tax=Hyalomma asiaticum TaxID=266040 RepID=A0ACB7SP84_HYAAI|nr:hypothetical protein HPB50_006988 [Hyalomma asiaticum]
MRGVRAQRRPSWGQRAPDVLQLARSVRGLLLSGNPHLRAWFILPGGLPPSRQQASQDYCLALKRPVGLTTMAATVYRVAPAEQVSVDRARVGPPTLEVEDVPASTDGSSTTVMVRHEIRNTASAAAGKDGKEAMDPSKEGVASTKRAHEVAQREGASADPTVTGEPPSKAAPVRRPTLRPRPTIPQERRSAAASPPPKPPYT